jgi:DNA modification methylase
MAIGKPYHKNPRQISRKRHRRLDDTLTRFGDLSGIVHNLETDEIIGGNQRVAVFDNGTVEMVEEFDEADEQGTVGLGFVIWKGKPYSYRQVRWDEATAREANIAANLGGGDWDFDILANQWDAAELTNWGFDEDLLKDWQRNSFALGDLLGSENGGEPPPETPSQIDKAEELRQRWGVELGQMWALGQHRIVCGDCTDKAVVERVMGGEKADCTATDPPFNVREDTWDKFDDFLLFTRQWLSLANKFSITIAAFFADKNLPLLPKAAELENIPFRRSLIWVKPPGSQFAGGQKDGFWYDFELIQVYGGLVDIESGTKFSVFDYRTITGQEHGAEKPSSLYSDIWQNYSNESGIIFEPFNGTGSNLIACENLSRRCRAIEIDPGYVAVSIQRWADHTQGKPELLE